MHVAVVASCERDTPTPDHTARAALAVQILCRKLPAAARGVLQIQVQVTAADLLLMVQQYPAEPLPSNSASKQHAG